jgi:integrase
MPRRGRPRTGTIRRLADGRYQYSVEYTDRFGKEHNPKRVADTEKAAKAALKQLLDDIERALAGPDSELATERTLASVFEWYGKNFVRDAEYHEGKLVAGRRDARSFRMNIKTLDSYFGKMRLADLGYNDLVNFKLNRLRTPIETKNMKRTRSFASVHRELATFRTVLNAAKRQGWISRTPFESGPPLIQAALETKRERLLTREEEIALVNELAPHLKPVVFTLLDTGCRLGECLALKWENVDLAAGTVIFTSYKGKGFKQRLVAMTRRLHAALSEMHAHREFRPKPEEKVFDQVTIRTGFAAACRRAKIKGLRIHDLRHTAATRMAEVLPLAQLGNILGHTQPATTARYVNTHEESRRLGASILDKFNQGTEILAEEQRQKEKEADDSLPVM